MPTEQELESTIGIALEAGDLLRSYFEAGEVDSQAKGDRDLVTVADTTSEALLQKRLSARFPDDAIVGEEGTASAGKSSRCWYVDPLDGTMNFARGLPLWAVSLALFEDRRPILGVIHDPLRRETFSAAFGLGAYLNGQRVSCSDVTRATNAFVHLTVDFTDAGRLSGLQDIAVVAPEVLRTRNIGSAALALAYVASGRLDVMLHRFARVWDYGAGVILVREAGGVVTDLTGGTYDDQTYAIAAAASESLHREILQLLRSSADARVE